MVDALPEAARAQLSAQPAATPAKVREVMATAAEVMRTRVAALPAQASSYLDVKTVDVLVGQVRTNVLAAFKRFHDVVSKRYTEEDLATIGLPSFEQVQSILQEPPSPATTAAPTAPVKAMPLVPASTATPANGQKNTA